MVETMEGIKGGQFKLLTKSQIHQIHQNTLKILEDPGIVVDEPTALKVLDNAGAEVDLKQQRVKIYEGLVEEAIKKAPESFIVYARDRSNNLKIGGDRVYFSPTSTHPFVFDLETGERRSTVFSDCEKLVQLNDCLDMVHGNVCPVHPTDVPERAAHAYIMLASASNTSKVFRGRNYGRQIAKDCIDMASILAGGEEELRKRPNMITIENTVSPLQHERTQVEGLLEYVKLGMPVGVSSEISAGATGPVTLAGSLVVQNAEVLTGIIITQLVNPGTPVLYGTVSNIMDMRTAQMSLGSIEAGILNVATAQLAHYYNIPCRGSAGATDSKILDMEAGYETALNILLATMGGVNYIQYCTGAIDLTLSVSYEKALIDNEVLQNVARALRGIDVSEETLAVDLIRKVEPGGHFLSQKHTLSYLEKEHIIPELADRKRYGKWKESGGKDIRKRARERVRQILADYKPQPLDKDLEERLKEKVKEIEKREARKI